MIERIKRKRGSSYRARIKLPNRQFVSKTFKRKTDAEKWERQMLYQIQTGVLHGSKLHSRLSFSELVGLWYNGKIKSVKSFRTVENYKSDIRTHLLPLFSELSLQKIERAHADLLIESMKGRGSSNRTINKILTRFKQILNYAVDEQLIPANPLNRFPCLKEPPKRDVYLTDKEIQQLLVKNNQEEIYPFLVLALNTGLRLGELSGLCWDRVNFEQGFLEITRTMTRNGLQETTKTHQKRIVPMNETARELLTTLMSKQVPSSFVFTNEAGEAIDVRHVSQRQYKQALKRAGLRDVRFHDLRHTFASHFMMKGGNIYDLQQILGHADLQMTKRYAHLSPDHLRAAINIVSFGKNSDAGPQKVHKANLSMIK